MKNKGKALQQNIIKRFMDENSFHEFMEQYNEARIKKSILIEPKENHVRLANLAKEHGVRQAAELAGTSPQNVNYALDRVGRYEFLKGK